MAPLPRRIHSRRATCLSIDTSCCNSTIKFLEEDPDDLPPTQPTQPPREEEGAAAAAMGSTSPNAAPASPASVININLFGKPSFSMD